MWFSMTRFVFGSYFVLWFVHLFSTRSRRAWLSGACCPLRFFGPFVFIDGQSVLELIRLSISIFDLSWPVLFCSVVSPIVNSFVQSSSVRSKSHACSSAHGLLVPIYSSSFLRALHQLGPWVLLLLVFHFAKGSHLFV
jgi:hypothetical protein